MAPPPPPPHLSTPCAPDGLIRISAILNCRPSEAFPLRYVIGAQPTLCRHVFWEQRRLKLCLFAGRMERRLQRQQEGGEKRETSRATADSQSQDRSGTRLQAVRAVVAFEKHGLGHHIWGGPSSPLVVRTLFPILGHAWHLVVLL